jgi:lysophospholipase L1-like esterase
MSTRRRGLFILTVIVLAGAVVPGLSADETAFPLKDGDVWVMVGDSITAQHLHSNYFEAFCYARFPKLKFCFRNSGVGGDTIPRVLARFDWDVATWKPTVISVELGMNDAGSFSTDDFMKNMAKLVDRIRKTGARPVLFSSSPINDGGAGYLSNRNARLAEYARATAAYTGKEGIPYADQFDALNPWWTRNTADLNLFRSIRAAANRPDCPGREHLEAWLRLMKERKEPAPADLQGDPVHPGPAGQLTMAAALLLELKAPGLVSSATIDAAAGKSIDTARCTIDDIKVSDDRVTFKRTDECLPLPVPPDARDVLPVMPSLKDLSKYVLKLTGLKGQAYDVVIDGQKVANVGAEQLTAGWDMGFLDKGPIAEQCGKILDLVAAKEKIVSEYRAFSKSVTEKKARPDPERVANLAKKIEQADTAVREAAQSTPHVYVLTPAK